MLNKIKLFYQIRKFYNIFGVEVEGIEIMPNFITKLSDMTKENVHDVLFDLNEVLDIYNDDPTNEMTIWLKKLYRSIQNYCEHKPNILLDIIATVCILALLWGVFSTLEVASKNDCPNPQYSPINLWVLLEGGDN